MIGLMRQTDAEANTDWRVQRYWLDEVSRVMPDGQKATFRPGGAGRGGFRSFVPGGASVAEEDYELLGLRSSPPPSAAAIRQAFRRACMVWHPDKHVECLHELAQEVSKLINQAVESLDAEEVAAAEEQQPEPPRQKPPE